MALALAVSCYAQLGRCAEPNAEDRATARALAAEGYRALQRGEHQVAAERFERAEALVHAPTLLVDWAKALVGLGRLVEAHELYSRVLREELASDAPPAWKKARATAESALDALDSRLSWLTVAVHARQSVVKLDGQELNPASVGVRRAIDPGEHVVTVRAAGFLPNDQRVTLAEGESRILEIPLIPDPRLELRLPPTPTRRAHTPVPAAALAPEPPKRDHTLAYAAFALAGAGFMTATASGVLMLLKKSELEDACQDGKCPSSVKDDLKRYEQYGMITNVGLGLGVAATVAGVSLWALAPLKHPKQREAARISPVVAPGYMGVKGKF